MSGHAKQRHKIGLISLGCAKNEVDAERILGAAAEAGWLICGEPADADVVVVNTCAFIEAAKSESLGAIHEALALKAKGCCRAVIVAGCMAERYGRELSHELPDVDAWVGIAEPRRLPEVAAELLGRAAADVPLVCVEPLPHGFGDEGPRLRITPRHYAYLRIAEGCDNRCAYCAIPLIRGQLRSKPLEVCLREARDLAADGCRELILIAQDTTNYGFDLYGHRALPMLLGQLAQVEPLRWLRVLYSHPAHFDAAAIEAFAATPKLCPYVDIPVQHASDHILERMGRGTTRAAMSDLVGRLRARIPNLALRTTVLVGYPGETEKDFAELLDFIKEAQFDRLGAFAYSEEDGTRAATEEPPVPPGVRADRCDEVMRRQQAIAFRKARARVGTRAEVVIDHRLDARAFAGRSAAEAPDVDPIIRVRGRRLRPGQVVEVEITSAIGYDLEARVGRKPARRTQAHGPRA